MKIAVIGLGYVGLPLLLELSKYFKVSGFDINKRRILDLKNGIDRTKEIKTKLLKRNNISYTYNFSDLTRCDVFIICVPTPVKKNKPDISMLLNATKLVSQRLKKGDLVIYESTVYPGLTREKCNPILEKYSGLKLNKDFIIGYSPERINPGKNSKKISSIKKVISGSNQKALNKVESIYKKIIKAGLFKASSIEVAEAAKIIENTQRDINIALMNEFSQILNKMNISSKEVLEAAASKWNFIKFQPGLVGGHCIGVDPYYLAHKSKMLGINPKVILAGRNINDNMKFYIIEYLRKNLKNIKKKSILILGSTFKEDCPDFRNSQIMQMSYKLIKYVNNLYVYDQYFVENKVDKKIVFSNKLSKQRKFDAVIIAVPHDYIKKFSLKKIKSLIKKNGLILDLKSIFNKEEVNFQL